MDNYNEEYLKHYGMPRRSGRYPWGSGDDPYQHGRDFLSRVEELKKNGWQETPENIKNEFGLTTTQYRTEKSLATSERRALNIARAKSLREDGLNDTQIGKEMGVNESTVRSWFNAQSEARMNQAKETANYIREQIEKKGMIDVGRGVERELNISPEKMKQALYILEREGYPVYGNRFEQPTNPGQWTTQKIICPKGTPQKDSYQLDKIHALNEDQYISRDNGDSFEKKFTYPTSLDSKRLMIRYKDDAGPDGVTGVEKDGVIELRRNVADLSLGNSIYSQVRIMVDGSHYLKGMAVYSDNMPDGVDVVFNTNKAKDVPMKEVLKKIKDDPDNPFGSAIKDADQGGQYWYDPKTGERVSSKTPGAKLGLINKRADEGDWSEWKDALPSQFLAKQTRSLAKKQLDLAKDDKMAEYEDICSLNNPTVKKHLLSKFADECDAAAVNLQAAALPGQKYHVIIPINSLKDNEVYAPNYEPGTQLALIRYPHGGTFEIPICTVTHKNTAAKSVLGSKVSDAIGINSKVAERLSGADFDGDTVMCIPTNNKVKIKSTDPLEGLQGFDPKDEYGAHTKTKGADGKEHYFRNGREYKIMSEGHKGLQMGVISNLITDMTLADADEKELAQAVRHSMVVIDAPKHKLDYKQSELDNNIAALHKKYQGKATGGAATILSRAKGQASVDKRQGSPHINTKYNKKGELNEWYDPTKPEGSLIYKTADDLYYTVAKTNKRTGEVTTATKKRTQKSTKMAEATDAYELVSDARHPMEILYADYANSMKDLARRARLEQLNTGKIAYSATAKATYQKEVADLNSKLREAELNTARERAANRMARAEVTSKQQAGQLEKGDVKKAAQRALTKYRDEVGSISRKDRSIDITDREWEAIQAGAISESTLTRVLNNTDIDKLRERATPRATVNLSTAKINKIKSMSNNSHYSLSDIARACGVSTSTVSKYLKGAS